MDTTNVSLASSSDFGISVLNSLVDTIAVLDEHGIILAVNDAWRRFAVTNGTTSLSGDSVGQSYLRVCEQAIQNRTDTEAYAALQGLKAVLAGEVHEFHLDYPCHATSEERWFHMRIIPYSTGTNRGAIISHTNITPRIRADRALRKSQEQLKFALDATCDGLWDWDIDSGTVHFSDQWLRLLDLDRADVPSRVEYFYEVLHPEDRPHVERALANHFAGLVPVKQHEVRLRTKSGKYKWFLDRGKVVIWDASGRPLRMVGTITDITDRKNAETALLEVQQRTRMLIQAAGIGLWDWDLVTQEVYFSPEWKQQLGYLDSELPNRYDEWRCRLHPEDLEATLRAVSDFLNRRRPHYDAEFRMRHKDGSWRWIFARADFVRDASGRAVRMMGCHIDITQRKLAEAAREEAVLRLQKLANRVPGVVYQFRRRPDGTYCMPFSSDRIRELLRVTPEQVREDASAAFVHVHPEDLGQLIMSIEKSAAEMSDWQSETRFQFDDGDLRWLSGSAVPSQEPDGSILWDGFIQDISARKRSEASHASLEAQLREAQKMEAIGTLAGGIAHDFNNILTAILGNAELASLSIGQSGDHVSKNIDEVLRAGLRARDLVAQILSFSRRQPTEKRLVSLEVVIADAVRLLRATLPARMSLTVNTSPGVPPVMADVTQLQQVLINLATNSMQAMKGRSGEITICLDYVAIDADLAGRCPSLTAAIKSGTRMVRLTVSDDGPGIETAIRERIFEPFFTTKPVDQGTGLGLAVVHGIVQAHNGMIMADSQPGTGAVFTIYLPTEDRCAENTETADGFSEGSTIGRPTEDYKLVYIDDDQAVMNVLCRLFEGRGIRVSGFTNQQLALDYIRHNADTIDVVVTDNNMPGMQGLDVARAIREIDSQLPVAVISGLIDEDLQAAAELVGVRELINKPFTVEKFLTVIRRMTQHR